jgi:CRP-like cAMP-binding protein
LLAVPARRFAELIATSQNFAQAFGFAITRRLAVADQRAGSHLDPSDVRLARVLLTLAEQAGTQTEGGVMIPVSISQEDLASWIDASRSTVARLLARWRVAGYISTSYRSITIANLACIKKIAGVKANARAGSSIAE